MKRMISIVLSLLLIATVFASFANVAAAAVIKITYTNPVICTNVGQKVVLSGYTVVFNSGEPAETDVSWKDGSGKAITEYTPDEKGVTKIVASKGNKTANIYVVAKEKDEKEYVLFEVDFSKYQDISELRAEGYATTVADSFYKFANGALELGNFGHDYARLILPEWLGDFGDYAVEADVKIVDSKDTGRWFGLVYRIQNENKSYYPYYHMCVRTDPSSSNGIEFAERTPANSWNVASTVGAEISTMKDKYHKIKIEAFGKTVLHKVDDDPVLYVTDAIIGPKSNVFEKGMLGITMNYGTASVRSIKVTVQQKAPEKPDKDLHLINNAHEANNLINPIANVQKLESANALEIISSDKAPGSVMIKVGDFDSLEEIMAKCVEKQVLPTFILESADDVSKVNRCLEKSDMKDANAVSTDAKLLASVRAKNQLVRTGLIVDLPDGELTNEKANEIRLAVRSAPATFCVISSLDASYQAVDELQELALAVWVTVEADAEAKEFASEALRAVTSGANGIITSSASKLTEIINTYLAENAFTRTPVMIGHRGNPGVAPENTLSGFIKAYENGADVFEIDVEVTKDGEIIIMHDSSIKRTTTYTGGLNISQMTLADIKKEFILGKNGQPTEEKVPTLREVLEEFKDKDCKIFVEFKGSNALNIKKTAELVEEYGMVDKVDVISFNTAFLTQTQKLIPGMSTGYLHGPAGNSATVNDALFALYPSILTSQKYNSTINPSRGVATQLYTQAVTDRGITVWPWTYNMSSNNDGFFSGCDGVTTDDMQWVGKLAKYLTTESSVELLVNESSDIAVKAVTYNGKESDINSDKLIVTVIDGGEYISVEEGKIVAKGEGTATVMYGFKTKSTNGTEYVLYTQPTTVSVSAPAEDVSTPATEEGNGNILIIVVSAIVAVAAIGVCVAVLVKKKKQVK